MQFGGLINSLSGQPVDYTFRITQLGVAAIPEPETWTLMIVGFGLVGAAVRHRMRNTCASA